MSNKIYSKRVNGVWTLHGWVQKWRNWTQFGRRQYRDNHQMYIILALTQLGLTWAVSWPITIPDLENSFPFWGKQQTFPFFSVPPKKWPFFFRVQKHLVHEESVEALFGGSNIYTDLNTKNLSVICAWRRVFVCVAFGIKKHIPPRNTFCHKHTK